MSVNLHLTLQKSISQKMRTNSHLEALLQQALEKTCSLSLQGENQCFDNLDEIMLAKYKWSAFTKIDGSVNPWDHITMFEIERCSKSNNDKHKLQQFSSSVKWCAMKWNNNWPSVHCKWGNVSRTIYTSLLVDGSPVKIEHLRLCTKETKESFKE